MRFFTDEKFEQGISHSEYEAYCHTIWPLLPDEIKRINEGMLPSHFFDGLSSVDLHDARITTFDNVENFLQVELDANNDGALRKVRLQYGSTEIVKIPSNDVLGGNIENSNSDIMCHEIEMMRDGKYLHTLLFASGEELSICFHKLSVACKDME